MKNDLLLLATQKKVVFAQFIEPCLLTAEDDYPAKAHPIVDSPNEDTLYFQKEWEGNTGSRANLLKTEGSCADCECALS